MNQKGKQRKRPAVKLPDGIRGILALNFTISGKIGDIIYRTRNKRTHIYGKRRKKDGKN